MRFKNREEAGILLGQYIKDELSEEEKKDAIILAIPRGGVPVAYYISKETGIPFYIVITKKITNPAEPEAALGAVALDGSYILSEYAKKLYSPELLENFAQQAYEEAQERAKKYGFREIDLTDKTVLIVDDGVATGYTAIAASLYAKNKGAKKVILAVPVCPLDSLPRLAKYFDKVICLYKADVPFFAVGAFYKDFHQVEDREFFNYIAKALEEDLLAVNP